MSKMSRPRAAFVLDDLMPSNPLNGEIPIVSGMNDISSTSQPAKSTTKPSTEATITDQSKTTPPEQS
jgi:hypothetical protein